MSGCYPVLSSTLFNRRIVTTSFVNAIERHLIVYCVSYHRRPEALFADDPVYKCGTRELLFHHCLCNFLYSRADVPGRKIRHVNLIGDV